MDLTPLIDVVFQLMIFFMLTTNFAKTESIELSLPSASEASPDYIADKNASIYLFLDNNANLYFGRHAIDRDNLKKQLKQAIIVNPKRKIHVYCAPRVKVQAIVDLVDMIYETGGRQVAVNRWQRPPTKAANDTTSEKR